MVYAQPSAEESCRPSPHEFRRFLPCHLWKLQVWSLRSSGWLGSLSSEIRQVSQGDSPQITIRAAQDRPRVMVGSPGTPRGGIEVSVMGWSCVAASRAHIAQGSVLSRLHPGLLSSRRSVSMVLPPSTPVMSCSLQFNRGATTGAEPSAEHHPQLQAPAALLGSSSCGKGPACLCA